MLSDRSFAAVVNSSPVPPEQIDERQMTVLASHFCDPLFEFGALILCKVHGVVVPLIMYVLCLLSQIMSDAAPLLHVGSKCLGGNSEDSSSCKSVIPRYSKFKVCDPSGTSSPIRLLKRHEVI
jgi:hypothetical protein